MREQTEKLILRLTEQICGFFVKISVNVIIWFMSKRRKKWKHKNRKNQNNNGNNSVNTTNSNTTTKIVRREPVAVDENIKHSSNTRTILNMETTWPNRFYKIIRKPPGWIGDAFMNQIGRCVGTDWDHGAQLKFEENGGLVLYAPFECLEYMPNYKPKDILSPLPSPIKTSMVLTEETVKKGGYYRVVKKPERWKTACKFLNQTGVCILIDDRGVRLRFSGGDDVSFEFSCLEEAHPIDLNNQCEINQDNVEFGEKFRIVKLPSNFGDAAQSLVGKIGKAKYANYRGVCLKLDDDSGYVIEFDALERIDENPTIPNPVKIPPQKISASTIVFGRKYKFIKNPTPGWVGNRSLVGEMGVAVWASDVAKQMGLRFKNGENLTIPFDCIADFPRPAEMDLIVIIKKNPEKILRIIKGLNKFTRLRPVKEFIEQGKLPGDEAGKEILGPDIPSCILTDVPVADTQSEEVERLYELAVSMVNSNNSAAPKLLEFGSGNEKIDNPS